MDNLILGTKEFPKINNIVFDLGGVILNISYQTTIERFQKTGFSNFDELYSQLRQAHVFDNYDKGFVQPSEFRNELRKISKINFSDQEFDYSWNGMILDIPSHRFDTLRKLRKYFKIFLLSNTNEIHLNYFFTYVDSLFGKGVFESVFHKVYYSCRMGMRKPDLEIYHKVIEDSKLNAAQTLFIDDTEFNVTAAINAGLNGYFLKSGEDISELFKQF